MNTTLPMMQSTHSLFRSLRRYPGGNAVIVLIATQLLAIAISLLSPESFRYASAINFEVLLDALPILGIIAVGVGVLMIAGEFDLSVGSVLVFTSIVMGELFQSGLSPWLAALIAVALGTAIGAFNGWLTLILGLPSFIVTLGAMLFWKGMALLVHGASQISFEPGGSFGAVFASNLGSVPTAFLLFVVTVVVFQIVIQHHRFGNHVMAVGGNATSAQAIGIPVRRIKLQAFAISGAMAAFAGVISSARLGNISMTQGANYELEAIAACVVGGVALSGGRGSILAVFVGVVLINVIRNVLLLVGAPGFYLGIFVGAMIVMAAAMNEKMRNKV